MTDCAVLILRSAALFILFFFHTKAHSQCTGKLENSKGGAVSNASVTLFAVNGKTPISFAISDAKGLFSLKCIPNADSVIIQVSHMEYKKFIRKYSAKEINNLSIQLESEIKNLPEVIVRPKGIYQRNDTINYPADLFIQKQDLVLADFLKRLPGIEITAAGEVRYQGRPINRYYIEGVDLLEGRYSIANQNLPAEAVKNVQIIENHQPLQLLDSLAMSNRAALNIQLKDAYKGKFIGSGKAGIGALPLMGDIEFTPMRFSGASQQIAVYKYNNAGSDYTKELINHFRQDDFSGNLADLYGSVPNFSIPFPSNPSVPRNRYLFNNLHTSSFNTTQKLKNNYELKVLLDGFTDRQEFIAGQNSTYFFPTDTIRIQEKNQKQVQTAYLKGAVILTTNTKKAYLRNVTSGKIMRDVSESITDLSEGRLFQFHRNNSSNISNDFSILQRKNSRIFGFGSFISYTHHPERLLITPGLFTDYFNMGADFIELNSPLQLKTLFGNHYFSSSRSGKRYFLEQKYGFMHIHQNNISSLSVRDSIEVKNLQLFNNDFIHNELILYGHLTAGLNLSRWKLQATLPSQLHHFNSAEKGDRLLYMWRLPLNYNANAKFTISPQWSTLVEVSDHTNFRPPYFNTGNHFLSTFRSVNINQPFVKQQRNRSVSGQVFYRNVLKSTFSFLQLSYKEQQFNFFRDFSFDGPLNSITWREMNNDLQEWEILSSFQKLFSRLNSSLKFVSFFRRILSQHLLQEQLSVFVNQSAGLKISGNSSYKWFGADYKADYTALHTGNIIDKRRTTTDFVNYSVALHANLPKFWFVKSIYERSIFIQEAIGSNSFSFVDISLRKRFVKAKIDADLICQNIFNTNSFGAIQFINNLQVQQFYNLRPAQIMFKISYNFR